MKKLLISFSIILILAFPMIAKGAQEALKSPNHPPLDENSTFVIALNPSEDTLFLNPIEASDATSFLILEGLFEGLFSFDPKTSKPVAAIANSYTVSSDGLKWLFFLDKNARFSNGDLITASTFVDSWFYLLDQSGSINSYLVSLFESVSGLRDYLDAKSSRSDVGIKALSDHVLEIKLDHPSPYLAALLATAPFSAIHESFRKNKKNQLISSGPYVISSMDEKSIILEKNKWYHDYDNVFSDYIKFVYYESLELIEAYLNKEIHWSLVYIPPQLLLNEHDLHIANEYSTGFYYFSSSEGPYSNAQIRKALVKLIPWDEIRKETAQIFLTDRLIPNSFSFEFSGKADEQSSYRILSEEGFPYGAGLPVLNMAVHRGAKIFESAQKIADIWSQKLGITVILDVVPLGMYSRYPSQSPYDFAFITWIGDIHDPFAFLNLFSSSSGYNLANYKDDYYDNLLSKAISTTDESFIEEAHQYILNEAVVIPIYHGITTNIVSTEIVRGWYDNILNIHPLKSLEVLKLE